MKALLIIVFVIVMLAVTIVALCTINRSKYRFHERPDEEPFDFPFDEEPH